MSKPFLHRKIVRVAFTLVLIFVLIQFYRPSLDNPPVTAEINAPLRVRQILRRACYDCHSNETNLRWYDQPAPAYWLVVKDVKEGRKVLNFSNWDSLSPDQQQSRLFEALNQIVFHAMPLKQYTFAHRDAQLDTADIAVLREWLKTRMNPGILSCLEIGRASEEMNRWTAFESHPDSVASRAVRTRAAPNGLAFMPEYRDWQPVSSTQRWDNGTMRVILGNPNAVKAIRERHTNPWPDGTVFAKVAWDAFIDTAGTMPGSFKQVELMVKDHEKYAATGGWGWGRWKGLNLVPYGKNAAFTGECVRCHQPMKDYDLVFSSPVDWRRQTDPGSVDSAFDPLDWQLITSRIDHKRNTMSIVYGNAIAVAAARRHTSPVYPPGARMATVTWSQKEDEHWFGAKIPASILSIVKDSTHTASVLP